MVQLNERGNNMWKFECKKHLTYLLCGFLLGAVVFGLLGWNTAFVVDLVSDVTDDKAILENALLPYITGGLLMAGFMNGFLVTLRILNHFNISFFIAMMIFMFTGELIPIIGSALLIPTIIVCIYGWLTIPNRKKNKELRKNQMTEVKELERIYRLHHEFDEESAKLGENAWKIMLRVNVLYALGVIALLLVLLFVEELLVMITAVLLYMMLFLQLTKYKNNALQPIISLLYEDCNPEACASAILMLAKKSHRKKAMPLSQQFAQCMIYSNDPHLAIDALASSNVQSKSASLYPYHALMAYAYYQLGDKSMVEHHLHECSTPVNQKRANAMDIFRLQAKESIENKLALMNENFNEAKAFYTKALEGNNLVFQQVDSHYYLGLIAFVQKDLELAKEHFNFVRNHGNKLYFKEKADKFLTSIDSFSVQEEVVEA